MNYTEVECERHLGFINYHMEDGTIQYTCPCNPDPEVQNRNRPRFHGQVMVANFPMSEDTKKFIRFCIHNSRLKFDLPNLYEKIEELQTDYREQLDEEIDVTEFPKGWWWDYGKIKGSRAGTPNKYSFRIEFKPTDDFTLEDAEKFLLDKYHKKVKELKDGWYHISNSQVIWFLLHNGLRFDNRFDKVEVENKLDTPLEDQLPI